MGEESSGAQPRSSSTSSPLDPHSLMHPNSRTMASLTSLAFICFLFSAYAYTKISGEMQK
jgi:hypothetical protein